MAITDDEIRRLGGLIDRKNKENAVLALALDGAISDCLESKGKPKHGADHEEMLSNYMARAREQLSKKTT